MQLDNAAKLVVDRFGKGTFEVGTVSVPVENEEEQRDLTVITTRIYKIERASDHSK